MKQEISTRDSSVKNPVGLFSHRKFWAARFGAAPMLPTSRAEMEELGWDSCDIIIVTGDAYIDHPSFGMAIIGRLLEAQGFRVGIISQPDWSRGDSFEALGKPNLFFGITAGNMDSMVNHYTSDRRIRRDDSYTAGRGGGEATRPRGNCLQPSPAALLLREFAVVIGGIEASLRRIAQYDHWTEQVRRSVLLDSKADLLVYGNAERAIVEIAHRAARREQPKNDARDSRHCLYPRPAFPKADDIEIPSAWWTRLKKLHPPDPYATSPGADKIGSIVPRQQSATELPPMRAPETSAPEPVNFFRRVARAAIWCACPIMRIWWSRIGFSMPMPRGFCIRRVTPAMLAP